MHKTCLYQICLELMRESREQWEEKRFFIDCLSESVKKNLNLTHELLHCFMSGMMSNISWLNTKNERQPRQEWSNSSTGTSLSKKWWSISSIDDDNDALHECTLPLTVKEVNAMHENGLWCKQHNLILKTILHIDNGWSLSTTYQHLSHVTVVKVAALHMLSLDYGKPWVTLKALWMTMMMSQDDERQESHNNVLDAIIFVWLTSPFTLISFSPEPHHRHLCFLWQEAWQEDYLCLCLQSLFSLLVFPVI